MKILNAKFLPVVALMLVASFLFGQDGMNDQHLVRRRMNINMDVINAKFSMPRNFTDLDSGRRFPCHDGKMTNSMIYTIVNRDSSIRIGFSFVSHPSKVILARHEERYVKYPPNKNYLQTAKHKADTIKHKLILYSKSYLAKFNADGGGEYTRNCTLPYEDQYPYHKVVFIHKKDRGHVEITYFYKDAAKLRIDKVIKETAGIVQYKN